MRIKSKFRDYYDGLASHDKTDRLYLRNTIMVNVSNSDRNSFTCHQTLFSEDYTVEFITIGFCGSLIPAILVESCILAVRHIFYDAAATQKFIKDGTDETNKNDTKRFRWSSIGLRDLIDEWFNIPVKTKKFFATRSNVVNPNNKTIFIEHRVPIFIVRPSRTRNTPDVIELNPDLSKYHFYRVKDAYSAYQEIEMYLNGPLAEPDRMHIEPISDKLKAESKGFDKFSFRKDKTRK